MTQDDLQIKVDSLQRLQAFIIPPNHTIIDIITGDLDQDLVDELLVVYNTQVNVDSFESIPRALHIYKNFDEKWQLWKHSNQALKGSQDGGMLGDPYNGIEIREGQLIVSHFGGSSWRWNTSDTYCYKDEELYLIHHSNSYGRPCDYFFEMNYNLVTGEINIKKEFEDCVVELDLERNENESFFYKPQKIIFEKRFETELDIKSPQYNHLISWD